MFKIYILLGKLGTALSTQPRKVVGQLARAHKHFTVLCWTVQELRRFKVIYGRALIGQMNDMNAIAYLILLCKSLGFILSMGDINKVPGIKSEVCSQS